MDSPFEIEKFRAWLAAKAPDEVVGLAQLTDRCPLANFLGRRVRSGAGTHLKDGSWHHRDGLPLVAVRFVNGVDRLGPRPVDERGGYVPPKERAERPVTAAECLKILDEVLAQLQVPLIVNHPLP